MTELLQQRNNYEKIKAYVGFALKAKNVIIGTDNIIKNSKHGLVLMSSKLSQNAKDKIKTHAKNKLLVIELSSADFDYIIGKKNICVIKIIMKDIENAIINSLQKNQEE